MLSWFAIACENQSKLPTSTAADGAGTPQCQQIQHRLGVTEVCGQPQTIVVLNPYMLELLLSLDRQPAGYADFFAIYKGASFDNPSQQIPYLGERVTTEPVNLGTSSQPSLEAIAALKPDLILGCIEELENQYTLLSQIAPTLLFTYRGANNWQQSIQAIAQSIHQEEQAQQVLTVFEEKLSAARQTLQPFVEQQPKVLMLAAEQLKSSLQIANPTDACGSLVEAIGFQLVSIPNQPQPTIAQTVSLELLPTLDADWIVIQGHNFSATDQLPNEGNLEDNQLNSLKQQWKSNAIAQSLSASQKGQVYFIPTYLCRGLPGPIGAEIFLEQLQHFLLPSQ
ncbi:MAG: iron-siderophore ABC transporter substrate-binding protein [Microcoleus sp. SIO2G3]|nr:iron-siderophore ABC transporter substrate-binding protein [Microcoleus sp. SIO2G3]